MRRRRICAHLAADVICIDSWGYPIIVNDRLEHRTRRQAQKAIAACPHRALFIDEHGRASNNRSQDPATNQGEDVTEN